MKLKPFYLSASQSCDISPLPQLFCHRAWFWNVQVGRQCLLLIHQGYGSVHLFQLGFIYIYTNTQGVICIYIYIYVCSFYIPNHGSLQTFLKVKIDGECKYQKVGTSKGSKIQPICRRLCRQVRRTVCHARQVKKLGEPTSLLGGVFFSCQKWGKTMPIPWSMGLVYLPTFGWFLWFSSR